jgi:hypothetical protein
MNPRENNELMYGPILAKYMENLCLQINNNQDGKIYVSKA